MNKVKYIIIIILVVVIYIAFFEYPNFAIKINWGVDIPFPSKKIYYKNSGPGFPSGGTSYFIFEYRSMEKIKKIKDAVWQDINDNIIEHVSDLFDFLEIEEKYRIDFNKANKYYSKKKSVIDDVFYDVLYIIYAEDENVVYIIENLI